MDIITEYTLYGTRLYVYAPSALYVWVPPGLPDVTLEPNAMGILVDSAGRFLFNMSSFGRVQRLSIAVGTHAPGSASWTLWGYPLAGSASQELPLRALWSGGTTSTAKFLDTCTVGDLDTTASVGTPDVAALRALVTYPYVAFYLQNNSLTQTIDLDLFRLCIQVGD